MNSDDSELVNPCEKNKNVKEKDIIKVDEDGGENDLEIQKETESTQLKTIIDVENNEVIDVDQLTSSQLEKDSDPKSDDEPILIDEDIDVKNHFSSEAGVSSTKDSSNVTTEQTPKLSSNTQLEQPCFIDLEKISNNTKVNADDESKNSKEKSHVLHHHPPGFLRSCKFCSQELETLSDPSGWLSDVIINAYLNLVVNGRPNWIVLDSYIIEDIRIRKKRSTKRRRSLLPPTWMETPNMLIPVFAEAHWSLLHVQIHERNLRVYNSMISSSEDDEAVGVIADYLASEYLMATGKQIVWNKINEMIPVQDNLHDCGVFVCMFARIAVQKLSKHINPSIAQSFRSVIYSELIQNRLC